MTNNNYGDLQKRIKEIENRKLEILLETANINKSYEEKVISLNSEYTSLDKEQYLLQIELIRRTHRG